jgi:hypothetical protein
MEGRMMRRVRIVQKITKTKAVVDKEEGCGVTCARSVTLNTCIRCGMQYWRLRLR